MIGRTNTGGGITLHVIGVNTKPSGAGENTIWLNTDVTVPDWCIQNNEPENPAVGDVWITTRSATDNVLNISNPHAVMLYLGTARQWQTVDNENKWVDLQGEVFYGGAWHNIQTFVYDGTIGDAKDNFSPNIGGYPWQKSGGVANPLVEETDSFTCSFNGGGNGKGVWFTKNTIDFSVVKTVKIIYTASSTGSGATSSAVVFTSASGGSAYGVVATESLSNNASKTTITIDTENVTGEYFLGFYVSNGTNYAWSKTIKIYSIELIG